MSVIDIIKTLGETFSTYPEYSSECIFLPLSPDIINHPLFHNEIETSFKPHSVLWKKYHPQTCWIKDSDSERQIELRFNKILIIPNTLLSVGSKKVKPSEPYSDHTAITFFRNHTHFSSWNLMNEDNKGSMYHTKKFLKLPKSFSFQRKDSFYKKIIALAKEQTIVCLQEVGLKMYRKIKYHFSKHSPDFRIIHTNGIDSNVNGDRVKELRLIIYRTNEYQLLEYTTINPKKEILLARMKDRRTNESFWVASVHLYYRTNLIKVRQIIDQLDKLRCSEPLIAIGDFNNRPFYRVSEKEIPLVPMLFPTQPTFITHMESPSGLHKTKTVDGVLVLDEMNPNRLFENEISDYLHLFRNSYEHFNIYCKGGSVLGMRVLQLILKHHIEIDLSTFNLIKDFDFTFIPKSERYTKDDIINHMNHFPIFRSEGTVMFIYRHRHALPYNSKGDEMMLELSIKERVLNKSELEVPLSSMKIQLTEETIESFFQFYRDWYQEKQFHNINEHHILIDSFTETGAFEITPDELVDWGDLSDTMQKLISNVSADKSEQQLLASSLVEPDRLFIRLVEKNMMKSKRIREIFRDHPEVIPTLPLLDESRVQELKDQLLDALEKQFEASYNEIEEKIIMVIQNQIDIKPIEMNTVWIQRNTYYDIIKTEYPDGEIDVRQFLKIVYEVNLQRKFENDSLKKEQKRLRKEKKYIEAIGLGKKIPIITGICKQLSTLHKQFPDIIEKEVIHQMNHLDLLQGINIGRLEPTHTVLRCMGVYRFLHMSPNLKSIEKRMTNNRGYLTLLKGAGKHTFHSDYQTEYLAMESKYLEHKS